MFLLLLCLLPPIALLAVTVTPAVADCDTSTLLLLPLLCRRLGAVLLLLSGLPGHG
jgi:hypothetical protein